MLTEDKLYRLAPVFNLLMSMLAASMLFLSAYTHNLWPALGGGLLAVSCVYVNDQK